MWCAGGDDGQCALKIFGKGRADVTSWYKIWEAVSAVYSVCLKHGKVGTSQGLGQSSPFDLLITGEMWLKISFRRAGEYLFHYDCQGTSVGKFIHGC